VPRKEPALVLERVAEGDVRHVVQQQAGRDQLLQLARNVHPVAAQVGDDPVRHGARPERVVETGVHGAGVDETRRAELLDAAQALHRRQVQHRRFEPAERDVAVHGIADQHGGHRSAIAGVAVARGGGDDGLF
jgi:hypothetical protein